MKKKNKKSKHGCECSHGMKNISHSMQNHGRVRHSTHGHDHSHGMHITHSMQMGVSGFGLSHGYTEDEKGDLKSNEHGYK